MNGGQRSFWHECKSLFVLHWGERRGFLLLMLLLSIWAAVVAYRQWFMPPPQVDIGPLLAEMEVWAAERQARQVGEERALTPFLFDPNTIDHAGWLALGLSERQAGSIERFKEKGGRFRVKRDLARMYTLGAEEYEALEPYIDLPDSLERTPRKQRPSPKRWADERPARAASPPPAPAPVKPRVEVNTADSAALVALPGIGPSFARGIISYRDQLGGYHSLDQLAEVYILKDKPDALERIRMLLVVDTLAVRRIPINSCTAEELAAHPYARWRIARPLIAYRMQHGPFQRIEDIRGCAVVDTVVFAKLAPYLSLE
jgi:competence protein ComEA